MAGERRGNTRREPQERGDILLTAPRFGSEELHEIAGAMADGWVAPGPRTARFETALRAYLGVEHLKALNSCTAGLTLGLVLHGVGPGDEVLVPSLTFVACASAVAHRGAVPVLVDCEPGTGLMDLEHARSLVTERTRAAFVVHLHGRPMDMEAVAAFSEATGVPVIEDAAHAIGTRWRGRPIGAFGNITSFSFHASKNLTTVDGGAMVLDSAEHAERAGRLSRQGMSRPSWERHDDPTPGVYDIAEPGFKFAMHDVAAAIGLHQLRRLEEWIAQRQALATTYDELLADVGAVEIPPPVPDHARHAHHVYSVLVRPGGQSRDELARALHRRRIGTSVHFRALHLHSWFRERGVRREDLPVASELSDTLLSLPLHPGMDDTDVETVVDALREITA